jgi:choline-sulfatase
VPLIFAGPGVTKGGASAQPAELLDIYPTLVELCGLPAKEGLEGHSLKPQLHDAQVLRPWPAVTTHNHGNHSVRSAKWRYIRYADGAEELYDCDADPREWTNLAKDPQHAATILEHSRWLPKVNSPPAPGSKHRVLEQKDGVWIWEGEAIDFSKKRE